MRCQRHPEAFERAVRLTLLTAKASWLLYDSLLITPIKSTSSPRKEMKHCRQVLIFMSWHHWLIVYLSFQSNCIRARGRRPAHPCWQPETSRCVLTSEMTLKVHKGDIFPLLLPFDAWVLVFLCIERAWQHRVWKKANVTDEIFMAEWRKPSISCIFKCSLYL